MHAKNKNSKPLNHPTDNVLINNYIELLKNNIAYFCTENCIPVTNDKINCIKDCLDSCSGANYKKFRENIENFDICTCNPEINVMYKLSKSPRNHPQKCYIDNLGCKSKFVLLRTVAVHSSNIRKFYDKLNLVKRAHNFLCDLDTSLVLKDINYLIKLTRYIPTVKSKVVENTSRKTCIVNEETVNERFEDHYLDYLKFVKDLPQYSYISCESLIKPSDPKIISNRMKKIE